MYKKTDWKVEEGSGDWRSSLSPAPRIKFTWLGVQELEVTGKTL